MIYKYKIFIIFYVIDSINKRGIIMKSKIIKTIETLDLDRFFLHLPIGSMPHEDVLHAIELYGKEVVLFAQKSNRLEREA